jgi:hypothetical protein
LAFLHPEISQQWHKKKNGDLTPDQFSPGSGAYIYGGHAQIFAHMVVSMSINNLFILKYMVGAVHIVVIQQARGFVITNF